MPNNSNNILSTYDLWRAGRNEGNLVKEQIFQQTTAWISSGGAESGEGYLSQAAMAAVGAFGPIIYRAGDPSPSNLKPRPQDQGQLSFRDSLSNEWPLPKGQRPTFRPGEKYFGVDISKLPPGSVTYDEYPPGHVSVSGVSVEIFKQKGVIVERGSFPK
jgi:hypothetical protein